MPRSQSITLLLPNRNTLGLIAVLAAMWYAGASQNNGAAYMLCFFVGAVVLISVAHTWANLKGVRCTVGPIAPVYEGGMQIIPITVNSENGRRHFGLKVSAEDSPPSYLAEASGSARHKVEVAREVGRRGRYESVEVCLQSIYPLGFFTARRRVLLDRTHYVYPLPKGSLPLPVSETRQQESAEGIRQKGDDFAGVRGWVPGESMRHIDWKAAARNETLLVKQWAGSAGRELWLDWRLLEGRDPEARLRQLARWVLLAEAEGLSYGLALPGGTLSPARGDAHVHECLRALASYRSDGGNGAGGES